MATLNFISLGRTAFGLATILAPLTTWSLFCVPLTAHGAMLAEMFGAREVALGVLLYTAKNGLISKIQKSPISGQASETGNGPVSGRASGVRRLLWAGIGVDGFDFVCCLGAFLAGTIDVVSFGLLGGAAMGLVGMQALSLRWVGDDGKHGN